MTTLLARTQLPLLMATLVVAPGLSSCHRKGVERTNTIRLQLEAKVKGLDPIQADDQYAAGEVGRAYEGLLQYHYLKRPYVVIPGLADGMPEVSRDGLIYTIKIKKGVLFQDDAAFKATGGKGRELVAEDFVYSFKRLADPALVAAGWWILDGQVEGLNEWRDAASKSGKADYSAEVPGLRAVDRYTLRMRLKHPSSVFLYKLAMPFAFVVPREAVEAYGLSFQSHPVGTGPYRLTSYNPNLKLVWDRNPTYRLETYPTEGEPGDREQGLLEDAGKPLPLNDRVVVTIFEEPEPVWLTFMGGDLDWTRLPKDNYSEAITPDKKVSPALAAKGVRLVTYPKADTTHLTFNMADPLLGRNKALRQALSLAFDDKTVNGTFFNATATAAQGPIPPSVHGYDPAYRNPYRQFNLEKAKARLAQAGYPGGEGLPPLEFLVESNTTARQYSEQTVRMFDAIGVKVRLESGSWPELMKKVKNRKGQIWSTAWYADYPDAENFLQLFYSKNASPGPNDSNYSNPEFDKLFEKSLTLPDSPERMALIRRMVGLVAEDCPWLFMLHRTGYALYHSWLRNFKPHVFDYSTARYYRVDPSTKR